MITIHATWQSEFQPHVSKRFPEKCFHSTRTVITKIVSAFRPTDIEINH